MTKQNYSDLSRKLTKELNKKDKKTHGIYFTPPSTIQKNLTFLEPYIKHHTNVLEPSCGSCEYILALHKKYPNINITGIEYNQTIYNNIKELANHKINIINKNYLDHETKTNYDLIIGNPPYFVMKKKDVDCSYHQYFDGRPNIFILFIIKALNQLNENGILSFVLPKSFTNCLYYDKTRKFINQNFHILNIIDCNDDYIETKQETIIINILKKKLPNENFIKNINDYIIFGTPNSINHLNTLYANSTSLDNLGFKVNVGNVVWNKCKDILTHDTTKTRLIYSSDIVNKNLTIKEYKNPTKKNYIDKQGESGPLLVINRGYGVGNYNFEYCLLNYPTEFLIENHLICIRYTQTINNTQLIKLYKKIIISLENPKTTEFIKLYFGNNAVNTTELNFILPIYDI